jgi:hypothetical protein
MTELMVLGNNNTSFLDYMEAQVKAAWGMPSAVEPMVKLQAPVGISHAQLWSGRHVTVPNDRIVEMTETDAGPLLGAGWVTVVN